MLYVLSLHASIWLLIQVCIVQDKLAEDPINHGATLAPIILGSDKTTVSVATGNNEFYPLYASTGLVHNNIRRAHRNAVSVIGFLAIPKSTCVVLSIEYYDAQFCLASREHQNSAEFRRFRCDIFHASLTHILSSLKPHMSTPRVTLCSDGHYRRIIYCLGPYIADYPEQVLLSCIVQGWCARYANSMSLRYQM
jgi:hypothetical protein